MAVNNIGDEECTSLHCHTHVYPSVCCGSGSESYTISGWFLPNETVIPRPTILMKSTEGCRSSRDVDVIHLYRDSVSNAIL